MGEGSAHRGRQTEVGRPHAAEVSRPHAEGISRPHAKGVSRPHPEKVNKACLVELVMQSSACPVELSSSYRARQE